MAFLLPRRNIMERTHKTWGEKWNIFQNDLCEVSILYLNPNQRCSWHRHQSKWNQFFVIEGEVYIKTDWGNTRIQKGQIFTTNPGEWHEFQTHQKSATVQEIMYVKYDSEDIERKKLGGPLENIEYPTDYSSYVFKIPDNEKVGSTHY